MSRIGNKAIAIPSGVKVAVDAAGVTVEGKTKLSMPLPPLVAVEVKDGNVHVSMASDDRKASAMQGLTRSLINNMVIGVTTGFKKACGRPRAYIGKFQLCRICFRELASKGQIPGVTKASW